MRARGVDEGGGEQEGGDRALEVTRSVLAVYEFRFGPPPPALLEILAATRDLAELERWLTRVARRSAAQLSAELRRPRAPRARRGSAAT